MNKHHYHDRMRRAVLANNGKQLDLLAEQTSDALRAREILRAKRLWRQRHECQPRRSAGARVAAWVEQIGLFWGSYDEAGTSR